MHHVLRLSKMSALVSDEDFIRIKKRKNYESGGGRRDNRFVQIQFFARLQQLDDFLLIGDESVNNIRRNIAARRVKNFRRAIFAAVFRLNGFGNLPAEKTRQIRQSLKNAFAMSARNVIFKCRQNFAVCFNQMFETQSDAPALGVGLPI